MIESYELDLSICDDGFQYAYMKFKTFSVREILIDSKPTGEYHIKPEPSLMATTILDVFKNELPSSDVNVLDQDIIPMEYPIYIVDDNPMILESICDIFADIDKKIFRGVS